MSVLWIAGIALLALVEKTLPPGRAAGRVAGAGLIGWDDLTRSSAVL